MVGRNVVKPFITSCNCRTSNRSQKHALRGLANEDNHCLICSGNNHATRIITPFNYNRTIDDDVHVRNTKKIVLSTKLMSSGTCLPVATEFAAQLKANNFFSSNGLQKNLGRFLLYSPNSSQRPMLLSPPTSISDDPNWKYSFRWQLEQVKRSNGFMIQVVELDWLCLTKIDFTKYSHHNGREGTLPGEITYQYLDERQQLETILAKEVGVKIFRVYIRLRTRRRNHKRDMNTNIDRRGNGVDILKSKLTDDEVKEIRVKIDKLATKVQQWYKECGAI